VKADNRNNYATANAFTREQAEPWTIRQMRAAFLAMPERVQAETRARVARLLADEARSREFRGQMSALRQLARRGVYGEIEAGR
jgi:hypothetical protein